MDVQPAEHQLALGLPARARERLQHARPVDRVRLHDVLADQVLGVRPVPLEARIARTAERGDVVDERVEPHVRDVLGVERQRDAPLEPGPRAADREILKRLPEEPQDLVPVPLRPDQVGVALEVLEVQELEGDASAAQLGVDPSWVGLRTKPSAFGDRVELRLERLRRERVDGRPVQPGTDRVTDHGPDPADAHARAERDLAVAPAQEPFLAENLLAAAHRQSLRRHPTPAGRMSVETVSRCVASRASASATTLERLDDAAAGEEEQPHRRRTHQARDRSAPPPLQGIFPQQVRPQLAQGCRRQAVPHRDRPIGLR